MTVVRRPHYGKYAWLARLLPDRMYDSVRHRRIVGRWPNLREPQTINEKHLWLKHHYRDPLIRTCSDKAAVRAVVAERVGAEVLIPQLGLYDDAAAIDFSALPERFVLKATHGSGWNILCRSRDGFDEAAARQRLAGWLAQDYYAVGREWCYRGLPGRIIAEQFLSDERGEPPADYKLWCFNGEPGLVQVDSDRFGPMRRAFFTPAWQPVEMTVIFNPPAQLPAAPPELPQLLAVARRLAVGFPFVRVDLYLHAGRIYFGELTFLAAKGVSAIRPYAADVQLGALLRLPTAADSPYVR